MFRIDERVVIRNLTIPDLKTNPIDERQDTFKDGKIIFKDSFEFNYDLDCELDSGWEWDSE